jgi:hypothetical protein
MALRRALTTAATARCSRWDSYQRSAAAASSASLGWDKRMACWLRAAPLSTAPLSTAHAGCWDSTLQPQGDKCAHGNEQSGTNAHAPKNLPRRWLIFRYGHRRGKRCDVAAGCRRSEAHEFRAELAYLSYLERQPPRMRSCIMRLIASSILVSPSSHFHRKMLCFTVFKIAQDATARNVEQHRRRNTQISLINKIILDTCCCGKYLTIFAAVAYLGSI